MAGVEFFMPSDLVGPAAGADPAWQLKQRALEQVDTFKGGVPTDANGGLDYGAMVKALYSKGAFEPANALIGVGVQQRQLDDAGKLTSGMTNWLAPDGGDAQPSATSSVSSKGMNPEVVGYIRERSPTHKINPNVALAVGAAEGLRGFDPNGNANLGDEGSSAGPFQLHYGGVAGGANAGAGLGDDFTAATGLDARNPGTWKQQVDFALAHAAKHGWGAFHGARKVGIGDWTGIERGGTGGQPQPDAPPIQVAQNGDSDAPPPSTRHPYAPTPPAVPGSRSQPSSAMAFVPGPQDAPPQVDLEPGAPGQDTPVRPAPIPQTFTSPPRVLPPSTGALTHPNDPSYGGQVPQAWLRAGHSAADWVRYARTMAALGSGNKFAQGAAEQWSKLADGLQTSIEKQNELTSAQKDARDPLVIKNQTDLATVKATARANAMADTAGRRAELAQEGEAYGKIPGQLAADADSARSQNSMIDEMLDASRQFSMGRFADKEQALNSTMSALGHKLGVDTSSIDGKVAAYEDFGKLAGQFSRQAMKEAGGRAGGIQELRFITNTLPSPTMSQAGFEAVANQLKGLGEFRLAKQQAGEAWLDKNGSMRGFDNAWNKNVTPSAFVMHRLQVDQPEVFATTVSRLAQSAQGRATLKNMRSGMAWAGSAGLFD